MSAAIERIRQKVERAGRAEWWDRRLPELLRALVDRAGGLAEHDVELGVLFIEQYVRGAPDFLESIVETAEAAGISGNLAPLLDAIVGYWELEDDLLPDHLGILGLADDAYLSLRLLERFDKEVRTSTGSELLTVNPSSANRAMAKLLGDELTRRLDEAVEQTIVRAELFTAIEDLSRWGGNLEATGGVPAPPNVPAGLIESAAQLPAPEDAAAKEAESANEEQKQESGAAGASTFTKRQIIFGNVSILALALGVGLFFLWRAYFDFPGSAKFRLFGWEGVKLGWLTALNGAILGTLGLSAVLASSNLKNLISHFYWPFEHLEGDLAKRFYATLGTAIFSVGVLVLMSAVCFSNVIVELSAEPRELDLVARLRPGPEASFLVQETSETSATTKFTHQVRLEDGVPTRLALRGLGATAVLVLRDKYNFMTVDALLLRRRFWRVEALGASLEVPQAAGLSRAEYGLLKLPSDAIHRPGALITSRWTVELHGKPRFSRRLPNRVVGESGTSYALKGTKHLFLEPADGTACPGRAPEPEVQVLWDEICRKKEDVSAWPERSPFFEGKKPGSVLLDLDLHRLAILFVQGDILDPNGAPLTTTKEAVRLEAEYQPEAHSAHK